MAKHSMSVRATPTDFVFGDKCIFLGISLDGEERADNLFDQLFPRSSEGVYHHYTTYGGFKGIVSSGTVRLFNLHKRFGSGEFRTFCRDHGLDGYLKSGKGDADEGYFSDLMNDLFYISLVGEDTSDSIHCWERFAADHRGVRLSFKIRLAHNYRNFRAVTYQKPDCIPAFREIKEAYAAHGLTFINSGLSRMPGFYQRKDFTCQSEHRLLAKRFPGAPNEFPFAVHEEGKGSIKFIESDLTTQEHPWFNLELLSITAGGNCTLQNVRKYLKNNSQFPNLPAAGVEPIEHGYCVAQI